jgi:hypothetical protein
VSDKEISNVTEQSFAFGDVAKDNFIAVNVAGKRSVSHHVVELLNDLRGCGYEISIINGWKTPIKLCLPNKMNTSSFSVVTYYRNFCPHYQHDHPNAKYHSCISQLILIQ